MRTWCKILPFFILVWIARRYGEKFTIYLSKDTNLREVVVPYNGVYIYTNEEMSRMKARQKAEV